MAKGNVASSTRALDRAARTGGARAPSRERSADEPVPIWLAYLRLVRAPNVFSAVADVTMGYIAVTAGRIEWPALAVLIGASALLYMAGMVLNDVFDVEIDRRERPTRPLPSGRIPLQSAAQLGWGMLAGGVLLALVAGFFAAGNDGLAWRPGLIGILLAGMIVLYDRFLKATVAGPFAMGACRTLNVLLGMSVASVFPGMTLASLGFDAAHWTIALGVGVYIVGVTWFARTEAHNPSRPLLILGTLVMAYGILLLAWFPRYAAFDMPLRISSDYLLPGLLLVIASFLVFGDCFRAIRRPTPDAVQFAVKRSILALILFDATLILALGEPNQAAGVAALYIAAQLVGHYVYST